MSKSIYVGNLPWSATEEQVQSLFADYGPVFYLKLVSDRETGRARGFGFVEMEEPGATAAIEALDNASFGGRTLRVLATPGHTPGSVCFLEEGRGALYTGDTACARGVLLSLPHSCGVATFRQSIRSLRALADRFTTIHPGHHEAPLGPEVLEKYDACATGILEGRVQGIPGESAGEACLLGPWEDISIAYRADHIFD